MTISPLSYYGRLLSRWLQSIGNVNTPRCLLSSCLRLCLFRLRFLDIWTSIRLASSWRWFFQPHAIGIWTSPLQGEPGFSIIDIQHHHSCHLANVCRSYMPDWTGEGSTHSYMYIANYIG